MSAGKIKVELDYRDFYALLELTGKDHENEFLMGLHNRFLQNVFALAAGYKKDDTWIPITQVPAWTAVENRWRLRGKLEVGADRQVIQTIKGIRTVTGLGLKEAKDYVDTLVTNSWKECPTLVKFNGHIDDLLHPSGYCWEVQEVPND